MDFIRCVPLGSKTVSNRAHPQRLLGRDRPVRLSPVALSRAGLSALHRTGSTWVWRRSGRVLGLAVARRRSGARSWELSGLFLRADDQGDLRELLDRVSQTAASFGAERVFLRLRAHDPLIDSVRAAGYYPRFGEVLCRDGFRLPVTEAGAHTPDPVGRRVRPATPADQIDLFRLYCAATPSEVRHVVGMSFDQWRASREECGGRRPELVLEGDSGLEAWLLAAKRGRVGLMEAMARPGDDPALAQLVNAGVKTLANVASRFFLVTEYQEHLGAVLERMGLRHHGEYVTLVRSLAIPVKDKAPVRVMTTSG